MIHPRKKALILERDNFKCLNCGISGNFSSLEIDHVIPTSKGGSNDKSNLQTLCYKCNMAKSSKYVKNKNYSDLKPIEKLNLIKERLEDYKNLTYPEFKVVYTQDILFKELNIDLLYLTDLFYQVSGTYLDKSAYNSRFSRERDKLIFILRNYTNLKLRDMEKLLSKYGIKICYQQISKICTKMSSLEPKTANSGGFSGKIDDANTKNGENQGI